MIAQMQFETEVYKIGNHPTISHTEATQAILITTLISNSVLTILA
jgi:hypothetical protein